MIEIAGFIAILAAGVVLGMTGAGGAILSVPTLVYLFGVPATQATGYSLFLVGVTSLAAALLNARHGTISPGAAAVFAVPSSAAAYAARRFIVPSIPAVVDLAGMEIPRDRAMMLLFAALMAASATGLLRRPDQAPAGDQPASRPMVALLGLSIGFIAGLLGAGAGFLIVPALILFGRLPVHAACSTSLAIIAAQSLPAFFGFAQIAAIDWPFLGSVTSLSLAGMTLGRVLARRMTAQRLAVSFGWFVIAVAALIAAKELFFA